MQISYSGGGFLSEIHMELCEVYAPLASYYDYTMRWLKGTYSSFIVRTFLLQWHVSMGRLLSSYELGYVVFFM